VLPFRTGAAGREGSTLEGSALADNVPISERLPAHLEDRYGIRVAGLSRLQSWNPFVHRVDREDGPSWVARVFQAGGPVERVEGDAEILCFLEKHGYPAERCAYRDPVSTLDGWHVLVTEYIEGVVWEGLMKSAAQDDIERTLNTLGEMLGRLHALPSGSGAVARDAGSWGGDPRHEGLPGEDIAGAMSLLAEVEDRVPAEHRARYESLLEQLERADGCHDLPRALVHPDFASPNIIMRPDGRPVAIDWTAAGRGPRIASFAWFLGGAGLPGGWDPRRVDAIVAGYRSRVRLENDELARLADAMRIRPLYFACWYYRRAIASGRPPTGPGESWCTADDNEVTDAIAARARDAFRAR
jgi:Ser/Thr protein kinase RdoA (MazF antagonist)